MSVKGFKLSDGTVVKYDYSSLDNIVTDSTLSVDGVAADAGAVGDELLSLQNKSFDLDELDRLKLTGLSGTAGQTTDKITQLTNAIGTEASTRMAADNALSSSISAETSARAVADAGLASDIAVERARISNIVAGATPGADELVDIRVGDDGVTYSTAGDAVRGQFADVKQDLNSSELTSKVIEWARLRGWNDSSFVANTKRLATVIPLKFPYPIYLDVNDVTDDISVCRVYTFSTQSATASALIDYTSYSILDQKQIIILPANTYWCFELSRDNNAVFSSVDLAQNIRLSYTPFIDTSLSVLRACADANAVTVKTNQLKENMDEDIKDISDTMLGYLSSIDIDGFHKNTAIPITPTQYKFLDGDDGSVASVGTSYSDWYVSDLITINPYAFYMVTCSAQYSGHALYIMYDSDMNMVKKEIATNSTAINLSDSLVFAPSNAKYIRLATINGSDKLSIYTTKTGGKWTTKKWVCIGDSLTDTNIRTTKHYYDYVSEKTGINIVELGEGGTGYKREYAGKGPFIDRVSDIPLDADVVTIFGSGNDAIYTIGDPSDTGTDSLCSAINATIEAIFNRIPTCQLGIVTPCPWDAYNPADNTNWMARYSEAIVEICKNWGVPCLDLYHCSNLRPWDATFRAAAYSKDDGGGVHPDETGHALIAPRFEGFLNTLLLS